MKQKVLLEDTDFEALRRGEELVIVVGGVTIPIGYIPHGQPSAGETWPGANGPVPRPRRADEPLRPDGGLRIPGYPRRRARVGGTARRKMFTDAQRREAVARVHRGEMQADVARSLGVSDGVLSAWMRRKKGRAPASGAPIASRSTRRARSSALRPGVRVGPSGRRLYSKEFKAEVLASRHSDESTRDLAARFAIPTGLKWLTKGRG